MTVLLIAIGILVLIIFSSFMVESAVEYVLGEPFNHFPKLAAYKWLLMYVACGVGVGMAFIFKFDFIYLASRIFELDGVSQYLPDMPDIKITTMGITLTGLLIGRGSNWLHDTLFAKIKALKASIKG